jgi:hypothetical protein
MRRWKIIGRKSDHKRRLFNKLNIAILILAHKNLIQLNALLNKLDNNFNIYIHIDHKSNIKPEDILPSSRHRITKQYPVYWGSYNQILATYNLMKDAYLENNDYYLLISGQDFPIKSNDYIINFIESNKYNDFIEYENLPKQDWHDGGLERVLFFWENRDERGLLSFILRHIRKYQRSLSILQRKMDCAFFGGANWFNLSKATMHKVVNFIDNNNNYLDRFKHTRCADEIWLQTLLRSKLQMTSLINDHLRYVDWHSGPEYPRILRSSDVKMIKSSSALFARKFDWKVDADIIKALSVDS